jgi:hypothetical protein
MMKALIIGSAFLAVSCHGTKEVSSANAETSATPAKEAVVSNAPEESQKEASPNKQPAVIRLAVNFISIGAGTDVDAKRALDEYILQYRQKSGKMVSYVAHPWGREGEVENQFSLSELSEKEQSEFISGLKSALKGRELIQIEENKANRFKQ